MKTQLQILTALALIIQGMVNGQTQGNQASNKNIEVTHKKVYTTLGAFNPKTQTSQVVQTGDSKASPVTDHQSIKNNLAVTGSISAYNKSLLSKATAKDAQDLLSQTDEMSQIEKQLRAQAKTKQGDEKTKLIKSANELAKQIEVVQIQASEINGKVSLETFNFNKEIYLALLNDPNVNDNFAAQSELLTSEAEQTIKLAKEMRQEAYAMPTNAGKLGTMINAEEKESIAISKQKEAINVLSKTSTPVMAVK